MLYMHDVWANWFEGAENGYDVCRFHEWRKRDEEKGTGDKIYFIEKIPLLYVDKHFFKFVEDGMNNLPKEFMEFIKNKSKIKMDRESKVMEYAAVLTDGDDVLIFDTMGYEMPMRKSRLIPRQERVVMEMIQGYKPDKIDCEGLENEYDILRLEPEKMVGLTRKERKLKSILMMLLDSLSYSDKPDESKYWLMEFKPDHYDKVRDMSTEEAYKELCELVSCGWTKKHEELGEKMAKTYPYFQTMWEIELESVK